MHLNVLLTSLTSLIGLTFTVIMARQIERRQQPNYLATGAIGVAAYLGAGTLFLHRDPPFGSLAVICILGSGVPALATNHLEIGFLPLGPDGAGRAMLDYINGVLPSVGG